jgi:hypothetical protein
MALPVLPTDELNITLLQDRNALLQRLQTLAGQANPSWQDFSLSFSENILLEAFALMGNMLSDATTEYVRQLSLATVTDMLALIRIGRPYGFQPSLASAAQVDGTFYLPNSALAGKVVTLPIGIRLQSGSSIFSLLVAGTIPVGANASSALTVECSEPQEDTLQFDGSGNQIVQLAATPVIDVDLTVVAGNGTYTNLNPAGDKWVSFLEMGPNDRGYIVYLDHMGKAYVCFGNGINGAAPTGTGTISYKTGGGEVGRVSAGASWQILDTVYDSDGSPVTVKFQNPAASIGGYEAMSVEEGRLRAALARRVLERSVTEEDFEFAATSVAGIARAAMMTSNHDSAIGENEGFLYCIAYGTAYSDSGYYPPATPTAAQLLAIQTKIDDGGEYEAVLGMLATAVVAIFEDITVSVKIFKESGFTAAQVKLNITEALQKFFAVSDDTRTPNSKVDFAYKLLDADGNPDYKIAWSHVFNAINDAEGVREVSPLVDNLLLNGVRQSVTLQPKEFPRLSTITIKDMDDGGVII